MNRLTQTSTAYSFISGKTFTVGYGYDAASNRASMTDPQSAATACVYDTLNRLTTLTYPSRTNFTFSYDALGRRTKLVRPNGVTTNYQYDTISDLLSALHQVSGKSGTTTLDGATYQYDVAGNRTSKTDNRTNATSNFSYDPTYQLTQVVQGSTTKETYSYDLVGNRLSSLGVSPYAYNGSNELTSKPGATYTYDSNGNMLTKTDSTGTTTYTWDFENRLTSVALPGPGGTVTFKYDPFGRRAQKSSLLGITNYLYDGADSLEEVDTSGNVLARYTRGPAIDQPLAEVRSGTTSYYQADGLGSVTSLSNSSGALANTYTYDSFGNLTASTGTLTNPLRYTAREFDSETSIYFYRARYYDESIGRFLSEDPIRFLASGTDFYTYALGDPANYIDPQGRDIGVIENGPTQDNPYGHTAIAVTGQGVFSFGNGVDLGSSLSAYLLQQASRRDSTVYVIATTPQQDAAVLAFLRKFKNSKLPRERLQVLRDNCATRSNEALDAAGLPALDIAAMSGPGDTGLLLPPQVFPGSAGDRAAIAGATVYNIPKGSTVIPQGLLPFNPTPGNQ